MDENNAFSITLEDDLKRLFGYNGFRNCQREVVAAVLQRRDLLAILPTGAGKSICYQLPAMLMPGTAIIVSPLISLMQDQVSSLSKNNIPAAFLNSSLHYQDLQSLLNNLSAYKMLYVAPERLADPNFIERLKQMTVSFFAIDEAHCISQWGHSFRPEYRQLSLLKTQFPNCSVIALTATATPEVEKDIVEQLAMKAPHIVKGSFDRPNLTFRIASKTDAQSQLKVFLDAHSQEPGIIYAATRKVVDSTHECLQKLGFNVGKYHAGLTDAERAAVQHDFLYDRITVMVATVAFGMGVHKPNIRFVVHMDMPRTIEQYYQEVGRAGRDSLPAECLMLYGIQDLLFYNSFLKQVEDDALRRKTKNKTEAMYALCCSAHCRRKVLLHYFGERYQEEPCQGCDNCLDDIEMVEGSIIAQKILSCIFRLNQNFGIKHVIDVLRGSKNKMVLSRGHDALSTYGIMADCSEVLLRYYIDSLLSMNFLQISRGEYPIVQWTSASRAVIDGKEKVWFRKKVLKEAKQAHAWNAEKNSELFTTLSQLRRKLAQAEKVPVFVIFNDRTLLEMASTSPRTKEEFLKINGIGPHKWQKYGAAFLGAIQEYTAKNGSQTSLPSVPKIGKSTAKEVHRMTRSDTQEETLQLFLKGKSLDEIAQIRRLSRGTLLLHLAEIVQMGQDLNIDHLVSLEKQESIKQAIAIVGAEKLVPIKERLADDVTYDDIRLVAAFYRR